MTNTKTIKMATKKQIELLKNMYNVLWTEMDWGTIGKKKAYTIKEASKLIKLNSDIFWGIMDDGQCTVRQYAILTKIAGRKPKLDRCHISYFLAVEWIKEYSDRLNKSKETKVEKKETKKVIKNTKTTNTVTKTNVKETKTEAEAKCTLVQYITLGQIVKRSPKLKMHEISYKQAEKWIKQYGKDVA